MIETSKVFNDPSIMEPKCPSCNVIIKLGINTTFNKKLKAPMCECGEVLR